MDLKELKQELDASASKENKTNPNEMQDKSMHCASNCEDNSFYVENSCEGHSGGDASCRKEVLEVDIVECGDVIGSVMEGSESNDRTDGYSSSFSGTGSEPESETGLNDQEADSLMYNDIDIPFWVRKRRLTDHWRRFIQPIMWRCKWLELRRKELESQAKKYDKELEVSYQAKQSELENIKSEGCGSKELVLSCHAKRNRVMRRKNRKRTEETTETMSYMLNHNLFYHHEYRKSFADGALLNDDFRNSDNKTKTVKDESVFNVESPFLELREGDDYLEQILLKIEAAKSEARNLKNRVDKVLSELPVQFASVNALSLPGSSGGALVSSDQKPLLFLENEDRKAIDSMPEAIARDTLISDHVASCHEEETHIPDMTPAKTELTLIEGPSRTARKRTPRNREVNEGTTRRSLAKEKGKTNILASRFKVPSRKRKRGKRRPGSAVIKKRITKT